MPEQQIKLIEFEIAALQSKVDKATFDITVFNAQISAYQNTMKIIRGEHTVKARS
jgi:hypothetical protein